MKLLADTSILGLGWPVLSSASIGWVISTDDRIFETFEQIVNTSIDRLNKIHSDNDVNNFLKYALAREKWFEQSDYTKLSE